MKAGIATELAGRFGAPVLSDGVVAPDTIEELAAVVALAQERGWRWRIAGRGSWDGADTPADLALSTRRLTRLVAISPDDLVATVEAGVTLADLAAALEAHRLRLTADPPGGSGRSLGSVVATATAGPLRHGFGPIRDQVLGCSVITADGRVAEGGGRVVKNVAGFDLPKLHSGGFGAFGIITQMHLRLRASPERDATLIAMGRRDDLIPAARAADHAGLGLCALELISPGVFAGAEWCLAARLAGTAEGTAAEVPRLGEVTALDWRELDQSEGDRLWREVARPAGSVSMRMGCLVGDIGPVLELVERLCGPGKLSAGVGSGQVRREGEATVDQFEALRRELATREVPLTVERAPWPVRRRVGHVGALRDGVAPITARLRRVFDPGGAIVTALEGSDG